MIRTVKKFFFLSFLSLSSLGWAADTWPYVNESSGQGTPPGKDKAARSPQEREAFREKLKKMTPEEQQKFLSNLPFYQRMSPEQQEQFRKRMLEGPPAGQLKPGASGTLQQGDGKKKGEQPISPERQKMLEEKAQASRDEHGRMEMRKRFEQLSPEDRQKLSELRKSLPQMGPEARQKAIQESPFFQNLSPEQQETLKRSMEQNKMSGVFPRRDSPSPEVLAMREEMKKKWEGLTPEQKKKLMDFRSQSRKMTPEQRREQVAQLPFFKDLSVQQRELLQSRFREFIKLPTEERKRTLDNYEKWKKLSPEEKEKLRQKLMQRKADGSLPEKPAPGSDI
jgi:hypothetical protein